MVKKSPAAAKPAAAPAEAPKPGAWGAGAAPFSTDTAGGQPAATPQPADPPKGPPGVQTNPATGEPWPDDQATEAQKVKRGRKAAADKAAAAAPKGDAADNTSINTTDLVKFVEKIERINEEISAKREDVKELFGKAKDKGYKPAIMRKVISRRAMDDDKRAEIDKMVDLYEEALR